MKRMLAMTIIHTTYGTSNIFMPGAREFIAVVMKLIPPMRNATNSSATATIHIELPSVVIEKFGFAESGGYAVHAPPKPPFGTKNDAINTSADNKNTW